MVHVHIFLFYIFSIHHMIPSCTVNNHHMKTRYYIFRSIQNLVFKMSWESLLEISQKQLVARTEWGQRTSEILFLPLKHKIHIFSPPYNIFYIFNNLIRSPFWLLVNSPWGEAEWAIDPWPLTKGLIVLVSHD